MPERDQCSGGFFFSQKLASPAVFFPGKFENLEAPVSLEQGTARGLGGQCRGLESVRVGRLVEEGGARYLEIVIMMTMMMMTVDGDNDINDGADSDTCGKAGVMGLLPPQSIPALSMLPQEPVVE